MVGERAFLDTTGRLLTADSTLAPLKPPGIDIEGGFRVITESWDI